MSKRTAKQLMHKIQYGLCTEEEIMHFSRLLTKEINLIEENKQKRRKKSI